MANATTEKAKGVEKSTKDTIISQGKGFNIVEAQAKRGTARYKHYLDFDVLVASESKERILFHWNRQERTDAINAVNRVSTVPPQVVKLRKLAKEASPEVRAEIEKDALALLEKYEKRLSA